MEIRHSCYSVVGMDPLSIVWRMQRIDYALLSCARPLPHSALGGPTDFCSLFMRSHDIVSLGICAVLLAEVVHHYFPKLVEIHNYSAASAVRQKMYNWATLNQKVFRRLGFQMEKVEIDSVVNCKPGAVELLLMRLQKHIADIRAGRKMVSSPTAAALPGSQQAIMDGPSGFEVQQQLQYPGASSHSMPAAMTAVHPAAAMAGGAGARGSMHAQQAVAAVDDAILAEKDATITELRETIEILELKIKKLEQVRPLSMLL